ncbi:MAG TPA: hypothetical protein K8V00_01820 [Ligilactobacillus acidipiscis]|uniref:RNA polymerase sigma factor 70 region 4 type 2 domain-containing protein n=1 Tax=Ligilactobacillus acidipiscis TaxID=89059 RepID=A0A921F7A9_9LACO|nr:hypothetical protein [Ligilactobacillus acidipiscis]
MNSFKENKKFLMQYRITQKKIDELEEELSKLDDQTHVQSQKLTGMPSSESLNDYDTLIVHKTSVQDEINRLSIIARKQFKTVLEVILKLNNKDYRDILELYFLYRLTLDDIALKINMSCRNVERLYSQAVKSCR